MGKARVQLGGTILHHLSGWYRGIFSGRLRQSCNTTSLKCKQRANVLLLMKVSFVYTFICFVNILVKVLFKVLKQNLSHVCILGLDVLGKLTLCMAFIQVLNRTKMLYDSLDHKPWGN